MDMAHVYLDGVVVYEHEDLFHSRIIDRSIGTSIFSLRKRDMHQWRLSLGGDGILRADLPSAVLTVPPLLFSFVAFQTLSISDGAIDARLVGTPVSLLISM